MDELAAHRLELSSEAEDDLVAVWESGAAPAVAHRRLLRRRLLRRPHLLVVPGHRGRGAATTASCAKRSSSASREGRGPMTPDGELKAEKYRLVVEGPPNWTIVPRLLADVQPRGRDRRRRARTRASAGSTTRASGTTRAARSTRSPTTASVATRTSVCRRASSCSRSTSASTRPTGFSSTASSSCNSFSVGQLLMLRQLEERPACRAASSRAIWSTPATSARRTSRTACRATCRCSRRAAEAARASRSEPADAR